MRAIINGKIILKDRIVENCALLYCRLLPAGAYLLANIHLAMLKLSITMMLLSANDVGFAQ